MSRTGGGRTRVSSCLLLVALVVPVLAGCGGQDEQAGDETTAAATSSSPADQEPAPPGTEPCADVWADGAPLPRTYQGCTDEAGAFVKRDVLGCSSGQRLVRFDDLFYGVLGGTIHEASGSLEQDRDYRASVRSCRA